jgi:hypothetical protein
MNFPNETEVLCFFQDALYVTLGSLYQDEITVEPAEVHNFPLFTSYYFAIVSGKSEPWL